MSQSLSIGYVVIAPIKKVGFFQSGQLLLVIGICGYCKEPIETTLIPIVDFDKKDGKPVVVD